MPLKLLNCPKCRRPVNHRVWYAGGDDGKTPKLSRRCEGCGRCVRASTDDAAGLQIAKPEVTRPMLFSE